MVEVKNGLYGRGTTVEAAPRPIYSTGPIVELKGIALNTIERNGEPFMVLAAHRRGFLDRREWEQFMSHMVKLLNQAAGT